MTPIRLKIIGNYVSNDGTLSDCYGYVEMKELNHYQIYVSWALYNPLGSSLASVSKSYFKAKVINPDFSFAELIIDSITMYKINREQFFYNIKVVEN